MNEPTTEQKSIIRRQVAEEIKEAIKVRREHHIACGADLRYTAGLYEAVRIAQEYAREATS